MASLCRPPTTDTAPQAREPDVHGRLAELQDCLNRKDYSGFSPFAPGREDPRQDIIEAWTEFLAPLRFDWWTPKLSFRQKPERGKGRLEQLTPDTARGAYEELRHWLRHRTGHWPEGVVVYDYGAVGDRLHVHTLLGGVAGVLRLSAVDWWRNHYGHAEIVQYDWRRGARAYLSRKYVSSKFEIETTPGFERLVNTSGRPQAARALQSLGRSWFSRCPGLSGVLSCRERGDVRSRTPGATRLCSEAVRAVAALQLGVSSPGC